MVFKKNRLFVYISLFIFALDAIFFCISYQSSKKAFEQTINDEIQNANNHFSLVEKNTYLSLEQLGLFISNDQILSNEFLKASKTKDKSELSESRQLILKHLEKAWAELTDKYSIRQLHYHFGPGSTSFLRVHKPNKFGDNMDDLRHIIVDTNRDHQPRTGFELGRVYAGLRSTHPVYGMNPHTQSKEFAGTLEVGTSYKLILKDSYQSLGYEAAVFLKKALVKEKVWKINDAESLHESRNTNCFVEAATSQYVLDLLSDCTNSKKKLIIEKDEKSYYIFNRPLYDYKGSLMTPKKPVGRISIVKDISEQKDRFVHDMRILFFYAFIAFVMVEVLVYYAVKKTTQVLTTVIKEKTAEIEGLKNFYKNKSIIDGLTGLHTRSYFMERLRVEQNRALRDEIPLSVIMLDIDHFKAVNDNYGHLIGDKAIKAVAVEIHRSLRKPDIDGRYGGEEFCIALPNTCLDAAKEVAERLRSRIENIEIALDNDSTIKFTASFGVAQWNLKHTNVEFVNQSDLRLYQSKQNGRNCVT